MENWNLKFVKHCELYDADLERIIEIKEGSWPHGRESQLKWIENNLRPEDVHCLLFLSNRLIGYMNLVSAKLYYDENTVEALGVGNVCVCNDLKGRGVGSILRDTVTMGLRMDGMPAILLCKDKLVHFNGLNRSWKLVRDSSRIKIAGKPLDANMMISGLNLPDEVPIECDRDF